MRWWYTYRDVRMRVKGGATAQVNEERDVEELLSTYIMTLAECRN